MPQNYLSTVEKNHSSFFNLAQNLKKDYKNL